MSSLVRVGSAIWNLRDATGYDVIMMNRDLVPETSVEFLEPWLARRNPRLIFDFDDAIHIGKREKKLRQILPHFAWITPGNPYLAEFARPLNKNITVWPTVVDTDYYKPAIERQPGPLRIGWSGSTSTASYCLPLLQQPLTELAKTEEFEFVVICNSDPRIHWHTVNTRFVKWAPDTEVSGLQDLDIGLMPLKDEPFERGKCGLKAIQYMGVGVPALVSPVGVNQSIVVNGVTGFHCTSTFEWVRNLRRLMSDHNLRRAMGIASRARVVDHYSVNSLLPEMVSVFKSVSNIRQWLPTINQ